MSVWVWPNVFVKQDQAVFMFDTHWMMFSQSELELYNFCDKKSDSVHIQQEAEVWEGCPKRPAGACVPEWDWDQI